MSPVLAAAATTGTGAEAAALALAASAFACVRLWLETSRYTPTATAAAATTHGQRRRLGAGDDEPKDGGGGGAAGSSRRSLLEASAASAAPVAVRPGVPGEVSGGASRVDDCDGSSVTITGNSTSRRDAGPGRPAQRPRRRGGGGARVLRWQ